MKYTDWIIPRLRDLEQERAALKNIPERILVLEMAFDGLKAANTDGTVVSGGENHREEAMLANIAERDELKRNLEITRREVEQIVAALANLSQEERLVLERFYIHREQGHVERLCEELNMEKSQVYNIKNRALVRLARMLHGQVSL